MSIKPAFLANKIRGDKVVEALQSLQSPNKLPNSAIENSVLSVNGQIGHIQIGQTETIAQVNSDWNATSGPAQILNKPEIPEISYPVESVNGQSGNVEISMEDIDGLSEEMSKKMDWDSPINISQIEDMPTLFSGRFTDLENVPDFSEVAMTGSYSDLQNTPELFDGDYNSLSNKPELFSGKYEDLAGKPILSLVAGTGSYLDLKDKPVLFTGDYKDLTNKPNLFSGSYTDLTNKPSLFSGSYSDLTNKPTIPAAQIQANWSQTNTTALDYIKNKPTLFSGSYTDLTNKPTIPVVPTNISSFINDSGYLTTAPVSSVNSKTGAVTLTATDVGASPGNQGTKYYRQSGTQASGVKVKYYQVTSDANGLWTVNLGTDFTEIFDVQAQAVSTSGITGVRQSTVNTYTSTATTISGMTWGNSVLVTILLSGTNSLSLTPNTVVRLRVEGIGN